MEINTEKNIESENKTNKNLDDEITNTLMENDFKTTNNRVEVVFKKPEFSIKIGTSSKKTVKCKDLNNAQVEKATDKVNTVEELQSTVSTVIESEKDDNFPSYEFPLWSGIPYVNRDYVFEVVKEGTIIERINIMTKPAWSIGRLANANIVMTHPSVSRYHAVIQFKDTFEDGMSPGCYIFDLESTHGTFVNKHRIKPRTYIRIRVGYVLKFGHSSRTYHLTGPEEDMEDESEFSLTELKAQYAKTLEEQKALMEETKRKEEEEKERLEREFNERGIDWGMGEDADEETDLEVNPYAETTNEKYYIDDPKRTLRGFMEREGHELEYNIHERVAGQFLCTVSLPIDDALGKPLVAEALVKGKKKEAVVQCALEACRILDRHGILRQATVESKKRKKKDWEENDYYDSDDDTFYDRTGAIEKKRAWRMKSKEAEKLETYESLKEKEIKLLKEIENKQQEYKKISRRKNCDNVPNDNVDSLDEFMSELKNDEFNKYTISKLKSEIASLQKELKDVLKLIEIAKPSILPFSKPSTSVSSTNINDQKKKLFFKDTSIRNKVNQIEQKKSQNTIKSLGKISELNEHTEIDKDKDNESTADNDSLKIDELMNTTQETELIQNKQNITVRKKQKIYEEDYSETHNYEMWIPPSNQSGDGRTSLNDKYGY